MPEEPLPPEDADDEDAMDDFRSPFTDSNLTDEEEAEAVSEAFGIYHDHLTFLAKRFGIVGALGMLREVCQAHQEIARSYVGEQLSAAMAAHLDGTDPEVASKAASRRFVMQNQLAPYLALTDVRFKPGTVLVLDQGSVQVVEENGATFRLAIQTKGNDDASRDRARKILCAVTSYLTHLRHTD